MPMQVYCRRSRPTRVSGHALESACDGPRPSSIEKVLAREPVQANVSTDSGYGFTGPARPGRSSLGATTSERSRFGKSGHPHRNAREISVVQALGFFWIRSIATAYASANPHSGLAPARQEPASTDRKYSLALSRKWETLDTTTSFGFRIEIAGASAQRSRKSCRYGCNRTGRQLMKGWPAKDRPGGSMPVPSLPNQPRGNDVENRITRQGCHSRSRAIHRKRRAGRSQQPETRGLHG